MGSIKGQKHNPYIEGKYGHLNKNDVVFTPDELAKQICEMFDIKGGLLGFGGEQGKTKNPLI